VAGDDQLRYEATMDRRHLLISTFATVFARRARAEGQPWSARLLQGGFDGTNWWAGLAMDLQPGWKTYWRVPGDGGIAPDIKATGDNVAAQQVHFPLPHRFEDAAGTTIGYKEQVVFPLALTPQNANQAMAVNVKSFLGVCDEVCIPAQFEAALTFDPKKAAAPDQPLIGQWKGLVPAVSETSPVASAFVETTGAKPVLVLTLEFAATDIFVEGQPAHYFSKPVFADGKARLTVQGVKSAEELKGETLRVTLATAEGGLEQQVRVG
jgi:DsbC/DsbD-like thiol-disulfide interchange protein